MLDYGGITLVIVPPQNILRIQLRAVIDPELALATASGGANALRGESRAASGLVGLFKQQNPRALPGRHQGRHPPAPAGADDHDIAHNGVHVLHRTSTLHQGIFKRFLVLSCTESKTRAGSRVSNLYPRGYELCELWAAAVR